MSWRDWLKGNKDVAVEPSVYGTFTQIYPKAKKEKAKYYRTDLPWQVKYDLAFDGGGSEFTVYYRTQFGARWSAFWWVHFRSWGGSAVLGDLR